MLKRTGFVLMALAGVALSARSAAAAEVARYTFSGAQASFSFSGEVAVTCHDELGNEYPGYSMIQGYLQGGEQIYSDGYTANGTYMQLFHYNSCTNVGGVAFGGTSATFTPPDRKLDSAKMLGSGTIQSPDGSRIAVSFDAQIVGVGGISSSKAASHGKTAGTKNGPVFISRDHSANSNRAGEASATITVNGVTFADLETYYAGLNINGTATISISK
jgi:hypothetical protein